MPDELSKSGLYFDEIYTLRVLDPQIATEVNDLKEECTGYAEKLEDFISIASKFVQIADNYAVEVEKMKMRGIGVQNSLKQVSKHREAEQQKILSQLQEKSMELDRLKMEYQHLQRVEGEQQEIIDHFYQNQ